MIWGKKQRSDPTYVQNRKNAEKSRRERQEHQEHVDAISAIANQLSVTTNQEQTDDDNRALREKVTIGLLIATVIVAGIGDVIFYLTMRDARASLIESERAWAGPQNAKIDGAVEIGKPVDVVISVQNTGREPALDFTYAAVPFPSETKDDASLNESIKNLVVACFQRAPLKGAQILYPANGFGSGFEFRTEFDKNIVDQKVIDGETSLVVAGCLSYSTFDMPKHSAFCYYYNSKTTKNPTTALNLCTGASQAD